MYQTWLDIKYANLLSGSLKRFKVKKTNPYLANCRCNICGDSVKNKVKARGYLYQHKDKIRYRCHNCGVSYTFPYFLKITSPTLHEEYVRERFLNKDDVVPEKQVVAKPKFAFPDYLKSGEPLTQLKKVSQLEWDHPVKQYVVSRKIPNPYHSKLFYAPKFAKWVNSIIPGKLSEDHDEPRLIIPFFDESKCLFGFQGRAFSKNSIRYITIIIDENKPKIYGLDSVDKSKRVYVTEGPIDSMFLNNAIAMAGSDNSLPPGFSDLVYVYDNEPRNKEIVKIIDKYIDRGYNVCIWPSNVKEKDINDMILAGLESEDIMSIINYNTFSGLMAKLKFSEWRKV